MAQDVSEEANWPALVGHVMESHGRLDVLVNNAGIAIIANLLRTTTEIWRRTLAVHLDGLGEPNDVAYMVLFLASDESKHVTGAELVVDNGDTVV